MNFMVKASLGILLLSFLANADFEKSNIKFNEQCQALKCNPSSEICRLKSECDDSNQNILSKCVYCALKSDLNQNLPSKTLLASSIFQKPQPVAQRLLAKSNNAGKLLADSRINQNSSSTSNTSKNETSSVLSYDDYYEYEDTNDDLTEKNEFGEEDEYLDDYAESFDSIIEGVQPIRKLGVCPKVNQSLNECNPSNIPQNACHVDTDCPDNHKCCEAECGKRICNLPITTSVSTCPTAFTCTLNCRLGYLTDSNGCLLCECQSCPSIDTCNKNCPSGYLKDLFGCDTCECSDQCPPFSCDITCPREVGYAKSNEGCPLCQCANQKTQITISTSSCQDDVHCPPGFRCLNDAQNVPMCQADPEFAGPRISIEKCPLIKCRANCGDAGYKLDENGCQTCHCAKKPRVECSRIMCRMYCENGFQRDENGCEICQCNDSPRDCRQLKCDTKCSRGYEKDSNGCQTCRCQCPNVACSNNCTNGFQNDADGCSTCSCNDDQSKQLVDTNCQPIMCDLNCKYGYQRDPSGCQICSCNACPTYACRMFCMYGFKKNSDGCDVCECDWTPVSEQIQCSERIPCTGNRICNLNLKLCELVNPDKINWFIYDFDIKSDLFTDPAFVQTFKNGLINNIATKYDLEQTQIKVSNVSPNGMTSFQVIPFFIENMEDFQRKIDQIDADLQTFQFNTVLPSVVRTIELTKNNLRESKWNGFMRRHPRAVFYMTGIIIGLTVILIVGLVAFLLRRGIRFSGRSESKSPIFDASYHQAPTEDDHYHSIHAPDGTAYIVVETDDVQSSTDKRVLV